MPTSYEVLVRDSHDRLWEGNVVTSLRLKEWAFSNKYRVVEILGYRPAIMGEKTDLQPPARKVSGISITFDLKILGLAKER